MVGISAILSITYSCIHVAFEQRKEKEDEKLLLVDTLPPKDVYRLVYFILGL